MVMLLHRCCSSVRRRPCGWSPIPGRCRDRIWRAMRPPPRAWWSSSRACRSDDRADHSGVGQCVDGGFELVGGQRVSPFRPACSFILQPYAGLVRGESGDGRLPGLSDHIMFGIEDLPAGVWVELVVVEHAYAVAVGEGGTVLDVLQDPVSLPGVSLTHRARRGPRSGWRR